jgi:tetratricopeptide (TPR) repeat protein
MRESLFSTGGPMRQMTNARFLWLLLSLVLCPALPGAAAQAGETPTAPLHAALRQGIDASFNLENQEALAFYQKAIELDRDNPLGYAFRALGRLFAYETEFNLPLRVKDQGGMLQDVDETLLRGRKRIGQNSRDGNAYFAMALAKIVKIRWALTQKKYITVAQEAATIWDMLEKAKAAEPQNYDVYFPIGLLHYHLDHLPAAARFFSSLLVTAADHQKGLQELETAAQKGDLLKELAQAEISSVYTYFEEQPAQALPITLALKDRYPRNYNFAFALANTLSELQHFPEAYAVLQEIEKGIQAGQPPFAPQLQPRYDHLLGRILFNQGNFAAAWDCFQKALSDTSIYNARNRVSALVRMGMIYDLRGERKQAVELYTRALAVEGGEGIGQTEAQRYLKTPYVGRPKAPLPPRLNGEPATAEKAKQSP